MPAKSRLLRLLVRLKIYFDLRGDTDKENTIGAIKASVPLRGANIWYLVCSALLASIGLDINSPAVIIGAMLISPLMSPILGIGLSIGIHDKETMIFSMKEFIAAVALSLLTSTVYFFASPLSSVTSEILARTKPTLLDVGVAFFGGVAGIVAGSRSKAATAIPGVAIATALMPPICSAGFGLAHFNAKIFFGAFYLFFINAVVISLSSYVIVRLLKFPYKEYPNPATKRRMRQVVLTVIALVTIPSILIFYNIITEVRLNAKIGRFISQNIAADNRNVIRWNAVQNGDSIKIKVLVAGEPIAKPKIDSLNTLLPGFGIEDADLSIIQIGVYDELAEKESSQNLLEIAEIRGELKAAKNRLDSLETMVKYNMADSLRFVKASEELKSKFPEIRNINFSYKLLASFESDTLRTNNVPVLEIEWKRKTGRSYKRTALKEIQPILKNLLSEDTVIIKTN
jgi:uncharacterized hydrophobic protein (TIGR00271 family)